jgi:hypothetical protein
MSPRRSTRRTSTLRIAETATRLKHRVSLVATLPAVRRLRNFLNPNSRLPDSDKDMILLGERYERTKRRDDEDKKNEVDAADAADADPGLAAFLCDLRSRVWITYRRGFPAIASDADRAARAEEAASPNGVSVSASVPSASTAYGRPYQYTTDAGWGCTLRVGQMLLANALSFHFFGRGYRRRKPVPGVPRGRQGARPARRARLLVRGRPRRRRVPLLHTRSVPVGTRRARGRLF